MNPTEQRYHTRKKENVSRVEFLHNRLSFLRQHLSNEEKRLEVLRQQIEVEIWAITDEIDRKSREVIE